MPAVRANPSTQQTDTSLIGAPAAGSQIVVKSVFVSSDTQLTVFLEDGSTAVWKQYVAANGGSFAESTGGLFGVTAATALTYTTSAAGNVFLSVVYEVVPAGSW